MMRGVCVCLGFPCLVDVLFIVDCCDNSTSAETCRCMSRNTSTPKPTLLLHCQRKQKKNKAILKDEMEKET